MAKQSKIPLFEISGNTSYEIGYNYGVTLRNRIKSTVDVYYEWFIWMGAKDNLLKVECNEYKYLMQHQCPHLCEEIEAMSKGSEVEEWKLYLINCRTEIYNELIQQNKHSPTECSGIMHSQKSIIAQNWDWIKEMHDNACLLRIKRQKETLLMMIEPGMVGKIGLNSYGIGCTLMLLGKPKFLKNDNVSKGLPIHIILRLFLDCTSLSEIDKILKSVTVNTYSCIGVADSHSNGYYLEFCGYGVFEKLYTSKKQLSFHTNHYLGCGLKYIGEDEASQCSLLRYRQLKRLYDYKKCRNDNQFDNRIEVIEELLTNDMHKDWPICRKFKTIKLHGKRVGTITTIIMDLKQRSMTLSRGNPKQYPFQTIRVNDNISKL